MKRIYFVQEKDEGVGYAVVAESVNDAKKYVFYSGDMDCDWIWLRVNLVKDDDGKPMIPPDDSDVGHIFEIMEGLKLGVYSYGEYIDCPICNLETMVSKQDDGSIMCKDCWESRVDSKLRGKGNG